MNKISAIFTQYKGLPKEIYIILVCRIINSLGFFVYPLLTLILTQKIGMAKHDAGIYITLLTAIAAPGILVGGKLIDTIGRKTVIILSQTLTASVFIICSFITPSLKMVYLIMLASIFASFCRPAFDSLTADLTTPQNRKQAFSLIYMGHNLGFSIAPMIGGFLFNNHFSAIFVGDALTTFISVILLGIFIKEKFNKPINIEIEDNLRVLEKKQEGSAFKVLLKRPILIFYALILFFFEFGYAQFGFGIPIQFNELFLDNGAKFYGTFAAFNGFLVVALTPIVSKVTHKMKNLKAVALGGLLYSTSFLIFSFSKHLPLFFVGCFTLTVGEVIISINSSTFIANHTPASHRGRINSILPLIYGTGYTLSPMIIGSLLATYTISQCWLVISFFVFIAALLMTNLKNTIDA